ncbi:MAG: tRNA (N(6)-L-threonylcarbamoyladenosine(37)-C(2))-methylthiotransferase MtaB [Ruminococcus sp.]|nr:tRNA (N(6)-L-threonylcarbamoyladenosine(37)-C(2))-methylthiotransferase MtaB [Ruminococcus sp.]
MKIFYYTFGCKVNQYETENIREKMESLGHTTVGDHKEADVCLINSCTVTNEADKKCRQLLHRIRTDSPRCILICAGCMTQAHKDIEKRLPECDIIAGAHNKTKIPELLSLFMNTGKRITAITDNDSERLIEPMSNQDAGNKTRSYIKIQNGCDMHCSYCIIPRARGHIRSKPLESIVSEAKEMIASGHKEIIFTGINLCCYGRELGKELRLTDAVEAVCSLEGEFRLRLSSLEPELISDNDIRRMSLLDKLCPQFHLSLQSGCDRTLKAMNRNYTSSQYAELCDKLRSSFSGCAITTDIMVGFPGETEADHSESLRFARQIGFASAHIFQYSRRPDTPADQMSTQIDGSTKHRRAEEMSGICSDTQRIYLESLVGTVQRVLFEKETDASFHQGYADNYAYVKIERFTETMRRRFGHVKILSTDGKQCFGEIISKDIN